MSPQIEAYLEHGAWIADGDFFFLFTFLVVGFFWVDYRISHICLPCSIPFYSCIVSASVHHFGYRKQKGDISQERRLVFRFKVIGKGETDIWLSPRCSFCLDIHYCFLASHLSS
jgi:hypothetical protein